MNNTWIKLYRKTVENGIMKDHLAWVVFSWLLLMVDKDGKRTMGRYQMSDELGIKPNTLYKVLHRLQEKWRVISLSSQKTFTEIQVMNWGKYQMSSNDSQMVVTDTSTASNTKQEYKNIRIKNIERESAHISYLTNIPKEHLVDFTSKFVCTKSQVIAKGEALLNYCKAKGKTYKDYQAFLRNALEKDFGIRTSTTSAVDFVRQKEEEIANENRLAQLKSSDLYAKIAKPMRL